MIPRLTSLLLVTLALGLAACSSEPGETSAHSHSDSHADSHAEGATEPAQEMVKGTHGGRLLEDGDFALEVTLFERGVPPEFRLYPLWMGQPVKPQEVDVEIRLSRVTGLPGGKVDRHVFAAEGDILRSPAEVYEPHSFGVEVQATYAGRTYRWRYDSPEGRVSLAADMAEAQGLRVAPATPGPLRENLALYGTIQPNAGRVRSVTARFPGVVRSVSVQAGDRVQAGQTLASVESNESLQVYAISAPMAGVVTRRDTNPGESAGTEALFAIADFSSVWAELAVFPRDRGRLKPGQAVRIAASDGDLQGEGKVDYISPLGTEAQTLVARVVLDNRAGLWTPGQFVDASIAVGESESVLRVPLTALQGFRDWDVVFVAEGETYQALPVEIGRSDAEHAEILSGLEPGASVVVANSYLVKADIEKSGASHDH